MNKRNFLRELERLLNDYDISREELNEVLSDYKQMIDESTEKGYDEESFIKSLGTPNSIVISLKLNRRSRGENLLVKLAPMLSTISFLILGFGYGLWHPGWIVFLFIPLVGTLSHSRKSIINRLGSASIFIAFISFLVLTYQYEEFEHAWMVFLFIPFAFGLENGKFGILTSLTILVASALYLFSGVENIEYVFLIPLVLYLFTIFGSKEKNDSIGLIVTIVYLILGFVYGLWHPGWIIFLLIPVYEIIKDHYRKR